MCSSDLQTRRDQFLNSFLSWHQNFAAHYRNVAEKIKAEFDAMGGLT